jgi:hypothetical protein
MPVTRLNKYEPGALWKTREELFGYDEKNKPFIIPPENFVLLLEHFPNNTMKDFVIVLFDNNVIILETDIGHSFDLTPERLE